MADSFTVSPAVFQQIPLEFLISAPLITTIKAHQLASETTLDFVKQLKDSPNMEFKFARQTVAADGTTGTVDATISAPMLALVKVPALNFNSLSISFDFSISEVHTVSKTSAGQLGGSIATQGILSKFVNASLSGSLSRKREDTDTATQSGSLHVSLEVTEAPLPVGLQKILTALSDSINLSPSVPSSPPA